MKKFLLASIAILLISNLSFAQDTAMDFTKSDCSSGVTHNLFADLDSGYTIIQAFDMIPNCELCIDAATELQIIRDNYDQTYPGKVRWYTTGYLNSYTCSGMTNWAINNGFTPDAEFDQGAAEVSYYGGMGMPTIVILGGGTTHTVYYDHLGYSASQIDDIETAIDASLSALTSIAPVQSLSSMVSFFPNPANDHLTIQMNIKESSLLSLEIISLSGEMLQTVFQGNAASGNFHKSISTSAMAAGVYILRTTLNNVSTYNKLTIVR